MNTKTDDTFDGYWVDQCNVDDFEYRFDILGRRMRRDPGSKWVDPNRTDEKFSHPYSYSEFFLFGSRAIIAKTKGADYSDRLWEWDYKKADKLWKRYVNTGWAKATEKQLSRFISAYHGKGYRGLTVVALAEGCNPSNGYPYWILWYKPTPKTKKAKVKK